MAPTGATSAGGPGTKNIDLSGPFASDYVNLDSSNSQLIKGTQTSGPDVSRVFTGSDVFAYITPYASSIIDTPFIPLTNLLTFSYSTHRDKLPVRRLGSPVAYDYTKGTRTIAGALVLLNFDRAALSELIMGEDLYGQAKVINMFDDIPPFDITLLFTDELQGSKFQKQADKVTYSILEIKGVRLLDEGLVTGTDEAYLETTFQYVAEDISYLKPMQVKSTSTSTNIASATGGASAVDNNATQPASPPLIDIPILYNSKFLTHNGDTVTIVDYCEGVYSNGPSESISNCVLEEMNNTYDDRGGYSVTRGASGSSITYTIRLVYPSTHAEREALLDNNVNSYYSNIWNMEWVSSSDDEEGAIEEARNAFISACKIVRFRTGIAGTWCDE